MTDEFSLIDGFLDAYDAPRSERLLLGPGDDAALWMPVPGLALAITTDTLIPGRHLPASAPANVIGFRALAINLSDLAAMGATPGPFVVALTLPEASAEWMADCARGIATLARETGAVLAGGNLSRGGTAVTITAFGEVEADAALRRTGAHAGDDLYASGRIGMAAVGREQALARASWPAFADLMVSGEPLARYLVPRPRVALGVALRGVASAAIDVSDGLLADLGHLCDRSRLRARLESAALPIAPGIDRDVAIRAGDDYELVFAAAPARAGAVAALARRLSIELTRIGRLCEGRGIELDGREVPPDGYRHF